MKIETKVVVLGTGTPNADPDRSGPCVAVIVGENSYLVDFGPGLVRRAAQAYRQGIDALKVSNLKRAFLTHLHSDHSGGYSDLILSPWVLERNEPLKVFGPKGLNDMTTHILAAYSADINERIFGLEQANKEGIKVEVDEISPGEIYKDEFVTVEAIPVIHGSFESYAYKFKTPDKIVVISGDTSPCENLINAAKDCDILVHEVYYTQGVHSRSPQWKKYHTSVHTSAIELGEIASKIKPNLLVMYHQLYMIDTINGNDSELSNKIEEVEKEIMKEVRENYKGNVISAKDLGVYE
ncbi:MULTISPECIES: MBL fold metallo-hydrolase [Fusobacterium]|jgi:ribonuclease BN (tRNA processing enzyme)|uniref:MBL fold metallo-hydrolase n=1 Tax=Fusobacterium TaxID=848 RepID=UPI000E4F4301|nr:MULTISPECIES: MBL fold metallo-hydrolase [Fusobacterium]MCF0169327.1 MBL fold metallo-hydrolase [Fusobacterium varium]RHG36362.1 MBL fold metallo-hydrolase [Fusobacterium varium]HBJ77702.1 MBL fold metallo-hydrolase [Fusobacterium sp.]